MEKNENLGSEISSKDLIIKMLSESRSQITDSFDKLNTIRSKWSTEKNVNRAKFELPQERSFIQPKKTVKACNNHGLVNSDNYNILSPNRYEHLEVHDKNSNTLIGITNIDHSKETVKNDKAKHKFDQNYQNIVYRNRL